MKERGKTCNWKSPQAVEKRREEFRLATAAQPVPDKRGLNQSFRVETVVSQSLRTWQGPLTTLLFQQVESSARRTEPRAAGRGKFTLFPPQFLPVLTPLLSGTASGQPHGQASPITLHFPTRAGPG